MQIQSLSKEYSQKTVNAKCAAAAAAAAAAATSNGTSMSTYVRPVVVIVQKRGRGGSLETFGVVVVFYDGSSTT